MTTKLSRLQDRIEIAVGIWLLISPWLLGFARPFAAAAATASIIAVGVLIVSIDDLHFPNALEEWMDAAFGAVLLISPWFGGYSDNLVATINAVLCGLLITVMAFWSMKELKEPAPGTGEHTPHPS